MRVQYLGSAAAERIPALFCACDTCRRALAAGGKNIMSRAQMLINDNLLVDFSGDTYSSVMKIGKTLCDIEYLLITHAHEDHFTFEDFFSRFNGIAYNLRAEKLKIFLSQTAYDIMREGIRVRKTNEEELFRRYEFIIVEPYTTIKFGEYIVTALPAQHASCGEALLYLIENDGKSIFYGNDTGFFPEKIDEHLEKLGKKIDILSLDCTKCDTEFDYYTHMSMSEGRRIADRFISHGLINDNAMYIYNHFSHNGGLIYDELVEAAKGYGFDVAYDGLAIEI